MTSCGTWTCRDLKQGLLLLLVCLLVGTFSRFSEYFEYIKYIDVTIATLSIFTPQTIFHHRSTEVVLTSGQWSGPGPGHQWAQ